MFFVLILLGLSTVFDFGFFILDLNLMALFMGGCFSRLICGHCSGCPMRKIALFVLSSWVLRCMTDSR